MPAARNFPSMSRLRTVQERPVSADSLCWLAQGSGLHLRARLGKDEVRLGQPLIGAGGKLVRQGVLRAWQAEGSAELVLRAKLNFKMHCEARPRRGGSSGISSHDPAAYPRSWSNSITPVNFATLEKKF